MSLVQFGSKKRGSGSDIIVIFDYYSLGTNLIHDYTAVTFSVKLAFFREKRPFPCFCEIHDFSCNAFTFIYEGFQSFINSFCADFAFCYVSHFNT